MSTPNSVLDHVRGFSALVRRRLSWAVRDRFPGRKVVRDVQGVRLVLPWAHRLPDYAPDGSPYGQNLVELALHLAGGEAKLTVLDIGANVGDSACQVLHAVDALVLCVEGDPHYLEYLHLNCDDDPRVFIVPALLTPEKQQGPLTAIRSGGTTRFAAGGGGDSLPAVSVAELRASYPEFADLRLVKSDTDGHDVVLVPAVAELWRDSTPVLFFEYDLDLSRRAGNDPLDVWRRLAELGYRFVSVWDQGGRALGHTEVGQMPGLSSALEVRIGRRSQHYWDVAVAHDADSDAIDALRALTPNPLTAPSR